MQGRQYTLSLRGEYAPKKRDFDSQFYWPVSKICLWRRQNRVFLVLWESSENQFNRPKKRSTKLSIFFENLPFEKILDPPLNA